MAQATSLSASALVKNAGGKVYGFFIGSATSGTVKIWDGTTAAGRVIVDTTTAVSAPLNVPFPEPVQTVNGIFVTIGGTATVTVIWE